MPSQKTSAIKSYNLTPCFGYIIELSLCVAGGKNCNSTKNTRKGKVSSPDHVINKFARSGTLKAQRGQKTL